MRERFRDGEGILATYDFEINHLTEDGESRTRNIERTATTDGVGVVRQQGGESPRLLRYSGTIMTQSQYDAMTAYYEAGTARTVFFREYTGEEKEVLITAFDPKRQAVLYNSRDPSLKHIWEYTIEMEVIA